VPRTSEATLAAIKHAVDIVALVGEYLPVSRSGSKFKALCPFHDDHNPSLELNPDRQSFKCWSCGAGGDVFDFVKGYERVDFPEALRMLADRAGVVLDAPPASASAPGGVSKTELLAALAWAESAFAEALAGSEPARAYLAGRGITPGSVARFRIGYAPGERGWLLSRARRAGFPTELLERAGLAARPADDPGRLRERFRGRLIFPIHDPRGRAVGFGGRVLPEVERLFAASGKRVAKYLNSPETPLFKKREVLYAADLARAPAREAGWVAVVEGYTDVIAAHQVGLCNVVGTLGTALGDDHVRGLRRLAGKVVLVFDGDDAGQGAADRALELFLAHEVDVRVLTLPMNLDPCDFLLKEGADAFRALVAGAVDPLAFALKRAADRFDLGSIEGAREAAEWVLGVLARVPAVNGRVGLDVKVAKALDTLSSRLRVPLPTLERRFRQIRRQSRPVRSPRPGPASLGGTAVTDPVANTPASPALTPGTTGGAVAEAVAAPIRLSSLDRTDRQLVQIVLNEPASVGRVISRVAVASLRDPALRTILRACYELHGEGEPATFERVALRLEDPAVRALAASLLLPIDPQPMTPGTEPACWEVSLEGVLNHLAERDRRDRVRDLKAALDDASAADDPATYRALSIELLRLSNQRPDTKKSNAS
jgi:DNA primase